MNMNKCPNCGRMYSGLISECPVCKVNIDSSTPTQSASVPATPSPAPYTPPVYQPSISNNDTSQPASTPAKEEGNCFGWSVLGFFIPLVGLILYFCWKKEKPMAAKASLNGMITRLVIYAITFLFSFLGALAANF